MDRIGVWNNGSLMTERFLPSRSQIDSILRFLPAFKRQGFWFERVVWESGQVSYVEKSPEAEMFLRALKENGWTLPSSTTRWVQEAESWLQSSTSVDSASFSTLQSLFSSWIQKDQLLPGHLGALYERGDLTAALERLQALSETPSSSGAEPSRSRRTLRS